MPKKKSLRLGRGLDSLLGDDLDLIKDLAQPPSDAPGIVQINIELLEAGQYQPRSAILEESLNELASSIKHQGVMQPILVRLKQGGSKVKRYEIIAGERRFKAAKIAGLKEVPVILRDVDDQTAAVMALIENIQREDLNPLEEAHGIKRLLDEFGLTHDAAAKAIGRSRSATSNLLRLLNLAQPVQEMLALDELNMGHARALLALPQAEQIVVANEVVRKDLSVRDTERLVNRQIEQQKPTDKKQEKSTNGDVLRFENKLSDYLGTTVKLKMGAKNRGQLQISFDGWNHLQSLLERQGLAQLFEEDDN